MKRSLLDILACPKCLADLVCESPEGEAELITSGALQCAGCRASYPIRDGIPRFVADSNYAASFGLQWNRFRTTQMDSASGAGLSSARFFAETGWTSDELRGRLVLDAGCGAGRFLEVAAETGARVVGLDLSNAIDAARKNLAYFPNVDFVQASLYEPPFKTGVFDACYCIGVLQHTPEPRRALESLPRVLKEGASAVVVAYERKPWTRLHTKYWIRPLTRRLSKPVLLRIIQWTMPVLFPLTEVLFRLPVVGSVFRFVIPVANYTHLRHLTLAQRYQWAVLDTFDMLSPAYDQPQTAPDLIRTLTAAGLENVHRRNAGGLVVAGVKR